MAAINESDLNLVSAFVRVVETGSFTAADRAHGGGRALLRAGAFIELHPKVQVEVVQTLRRVDLAAERFDLALRGGPLGDSSLIARRLGRTDSGLFASRTYLRKNGRPRTFAELATHRFVLFGAHRHGQLRLTGPSGEESTKVTGPLVANDLPTNADAVAAGVGIGLLPDMYFGWLRRGGLAAQRTDFVRLLPEYGLPGSEVSLVSPTTTYEPARVRLLRDFLADHLRPLLAQSVAPGAEPDTNDSAPRSPRRRRSRRAA